MSKDDPKNSAHDAPPPWLATLLEAMAKNRPEMPDQKILDPAIKRMQAVIEAEEARGPACEEINVPHKSEHGGIMHNGIFYSATFVLNVQRGLVKRLDAYHVPDEAWRHESEGGICPLARDRMYPVNVERTPETATELLKRWVYENFYREDARFYVGRPLPRHLDPSSARKAA